MGSRTEILGALECRLKNGYLVIRGWVATLDSRPVVGFRVSSGNVNLRNVTWQYGIPSRAGRFIAGTANCGFGVRIPMNEVAETHNRDQLVSLHHWISKSGTGLCLRFESITPHAEKARLGCCRSELPARRLQFTELTGPRADLARDNSSSTSVVVLDGSPMFSPTISRPTAATKGFSQ